MKDERGGKRMIHDYYSAAPRSDHDSVLSLRRLTGEVAKGLLTKLTCFTGVIRPYFLFHSRLTHGRCIQINF